LSDYTERKAAERGKSFARQVWETLIVTALVCAAIAIAGYFSGAKP